jgi:CRISPR-associated protein Csd1
MLHDLVDLGRRLRADGRIPPPGFADYSAPIRWTIAIRPPKTPGGAPDLAVVEDSSDRPRPDSGRTNDPLAYPLVDTAAYVFGIETKEDGKKDNQAEKKHRLFLKRLSDAAEAVEDSALRDAIGWLRDALASRRLAAPEAVRADHWVAAEVKAGPLAGVPLFEHPEIRRLWQDEVERAVVRSGDAGTCSVTMAEGPLVFRVPGKGYFQNGRASLLGLDKDAYVSYHGGGSVSDYARIGLSLEAADLANRALEYLSRSSLHQRSLVYDKDSDLRSVTSLFWMSTEEPVVIGTGAGAKVYDEGALLALLHASVDTFGEEKGVPKTDLGLVRDLLKLPWSMQRSSLSLNAVGVHFAVLSKNAYRVVVRDYRTESLAAVKENLSDFLAAASLVAPGGQVRAVSVHEMLRMTYGIVNDKGQIRASATKSVNHARALFRTAYFGTAPPRATLEPALARIRTLMTKEDDANRAFRLHALLCLVKLLLTHHTRDAMTLERLDPGRNERAYLCGRLLAVLGRIQQDALTDDNKKGEGGASLNRTITERYFGSASLAPSAYLGTLVQRATTAHLPKLPSGRPPAASKDYRKTADWADRHLQALSARIHELGGFPHTLDLAGQGEFALGYYHQRAQFYAGNPGSDTTDSDADLFTPNPSTDD